MLLRSIAPVRGAVKPDRLGRVYAGSFSVERIHGTAVFVDNGNGHLSRRLRGGAWRTALMAALLAAAACKSIIGLEDRKFAEGDGGTTPVDLKSTCDRYCMDAVENCTGNGVQAYSGNEIEECRAICNLLPAGNAGATSGNSASCRARYAAEASGGERDQMFCPAAAPGGGSPDAEPSCGSNCEAYCGLYEKVCGRAEPNCLQFCPALPDRGGYSAEDDFKGLHDTIQCRLAHLNAAARYKAENDMANTQVHCGHAKLRPNLMNDGMPCDLQPMEKPTCEDYCKLTAVACRDVPLYDSDEQCRRVCQRAFPEPVGLPKGTIDSTGDTLQCRRWHAYFALTTVQDEAAYHCPHAGIGGAGHCGKLGDVCPVYCSLLANACKERFASEYGSADKCATDCATLVAGKMESQLRYNVKGEEINTNSYQCRLHAIARVFENMGQGSGMGMAQCSKAFPKDTCSP